MQLWKVERRQLLGLGSKYTFGFGFYWVGPMWDMFDFFQSAPKMTLKVENNGNELDMENAAFIKINNDSKLSNESKFTCFLCKAVFQTKRYLNKHTTRVHCDPVTCDICSKELSNKKQLSRHVSKVHVKREMSNCLQNTIPHSYAFYTQYIL